MKGFIYATTKFEAFHKYVDAPEQVNFLRTLHRHLFGVKVWIEVFHNDRDIEFLIFKQEINDLINDLVSEDKVVGSCEMVSDYLYHQIRIKYPNREIRIEVNEDDENGSYREY